MKHRRNEDLAIQTAEVLGRFCMVRHIDNEYELCPQFILFRLYLMLALYVRCFAALRVSYILISIVILDTMLNLATIEARNNHYRMKRLI